MNRATLIKIIKRFVPQDIWNKIRGVERRIRTYYFLKRFPNGRLATCNNAKIFVTYSDENYAWYDGDSDYLKHEFSAFSGLFGVRKPKTIIDIGSHWGFYPAILDQYCRNTGMLIDNLICIEPDSRNINQLRRTVEEIHSFPVTLVEKAVSGVDGKAELYREGQSCAHLHYTENSASLGWVDALTLESILTQIKMNDKEITHIKLDIDGYEPAFFEGAINVLKNHRPLLLIEFWAKGILAAGFSIEKYWEFLNGMYDVREVKYPASDLVELSFDDLSYIQNKTMVGITNLLLIPKQPNNNVYKHQ